MSLIKTDYTAWLADLKTKIQQSQQRAILAVNSELVLLYWQIGREILNRQDAEGWGAKVIEQLARDLSAEFPNIKGFSARNLKYMRKFAAEWQDEQIVQEVLAQLPWYHQIALQNNANPIGVAEYQLQQLLAEI